MLNCINHNDLGSDPHSNRTYTAIPNGSHHLRSTEENFVNMKLHCKKNYEINFITLHVIYSFTTIVHILHMIIAGEKNWDPYLKILG